MSPSVRSVAGKVYLALLDALLHAIEWPDTSLISDFVMGFPIVGTCPPSSVPAFKKVPDTPTEYSYFLKVSSKAKYVPPRFFQHVRYSSGQADARLDLTPTVLAIAGSRQRATFRAHDDVFGGEGPTLDAEGEARANSRATSREISRSEGRYDFAPRIYHMGGLGSRRGSVALFLPMRACCNTP